MESSSNFGDTMLLRDRVYHALKNDILLGRFMPKEQINIQELAVKMNISSAPLREALNMLRVDGLVDLHPRKHATVTEVNYDDIGTVVHLRSFVEPFAAKMSVEKVPDDVLAEQRRALNAVLEGPFDFIAYLTSDRNFHNMLHQYSGSRILSEVMTSVWEYSTRMRYHTGRYDDHSPEQIENAMASTREHLHILDAFDQRDPELAYQAVQLHLEKYAERVSKRLSKQE